MTNPYIHLILIGISPVLSLFAANLYQITFLESVLPLTLVLFFCILTYLILNILFKNRLLSALNVSTFIFSGFLYGPVNNNVRFITNIKGLHNSILLSLILFLPFFILTLVINTKKKFLAEFTRIYNLLALFLIIPPLISISNYYISGLNIKYSAPGKSVFNIDYSRPLSKLPDIYFIILDRYAGRQTLKDYYNYDNSDFYKFLEDNSFRIYQDSWANYYSSAHSIASTLNMDYLDRFSLPQDSENKNWRPIFELLQDHQSGRIFKKFSYRYFHFGSWWWPTSKNNLADINVNLGFLSEFTSVLISNSLFYPWASKLQLPLIDTRFSQWRRLTYQFNKITEVSREKIPTFLFAHFIIPHEPFVFNSDGSFLTAFEEKNRNSVTKYTDQLKFLNSSLKKIISGILKKEPNSVIILQADEGPYPENYEDNKNNFDWKRAEKKEINVKMSILNAVYFPDKDYSELNNINYPV